jgi:hypothetical protein
MTPLIYLGVRYSGLGCWSSFHFFFPPGFFHFMVVLRVQEITRPLRGLDSVIHLMSFLQCFTDKASLQGLSRFRST